MFFTFLLRVSISEYRVRQTPTGIPVTEYLMQGGVYYLNAVAYDPVLVTGICLALGLGFVSGRGGIFLGLGTVLYLVYVLRTGGDFMFTRFLAPPLFCAAIWVAMMPLPRNVGLLCVAGVTILGLTNPLNPVTTSASFGVGAQWALSSGVADERAYYFPQTGLLTVTRGRHMPDHAFRITGETARQEAKEKKRRSIVIRSVVGMFGFYAGPRVHIIDILALGDAFLARLPAQRSELPGVSVTSRGRFRMDTR